MTTVTPRNDAGRPASVVVLQWFAYFDGLLAIVGGILFLTLRNDDELTNDLTSRQITMSGLIAIAIGVLLIVVATAFGRGSRLAWFLIAIVAALHLGESISWLFLHPGHVATALVSLVVSGVILYMALAADTRDYVDRGGR
jgi:hypothetical protein